jgi:hypothetical protein
MQAKQSVRTKAHESRAAIEKLYIIMRHLFIRGSYKPLGVSGQSLIDSLLTLSPEIYGSINDPRKVEIDGLLYIIDRLPRGIEECRVVRLISREGYEDSDFEPIVPPKRVRNCFRIDEEQMYIEMTRGRSDIYDILTHLTFMYIESEKIRVNSTDIKGQLSLDWRMLEKVVVAEKRKESFDLDRAYSYLSTIIGRTYAETKQAYAKFKKTRDGNSIFHFIYWLGRLSIEERDKNKDREIVFSPSLRERIGHHLYGEQWARNIKSFIFNNGWGNRPVHIISANLHSVMNILYAREALRDELNENDIVELATVLSKSESKLLRDKVISYAIEKGMHMLDHTSGTNLVVQIIDTAGISDSIKEKPESKQPILVVMDYAFGEQAYEAMDELLKPLNSDGKSVKMNVESIAIMGKAGTLKGDKGDIMIPTAHIFEGTADNYPFENEFSLEDFEDTGLKVFVGPMITVLGTSLQNKDILQYFMQSSWQTIGLEMEGAHYQKAIQSASKIRKSVRPDLKLMYAYYASDNPLITGKTLASGGLGMDGVKPTYLITSKILEKILGKNLRRQSL